MWKCEDALPIPPVKKQKLNKNVPDMNAVLLTWSYSVAETHAQSGVRLSCRPWCFSLFFSIKLVIKTKLNKQEHLKIHQCDNNYLKWQKARLEKNIKYVLFSLIHVPHTNIEEAGHMTPYCNQPPEGDSDDFTFRELSCLHIHIKSMVVTTAPRSLKYTLIHEKGQVASSNLWFTRLIPYNLSC